MNNILSKDVLKELDSINKSINKCRRCKDLVENFETLETISYGIDRDILILGEAPANNGWRKSGKAFYDINDKLLPSGKVLNELLKPLNKRIEDIFFLEAIKCFPKKRSNLDKCSVMCRDYLIRQIKLINPKIILTMGDYATRSLLNIKYSKYKDVVGKVYYLDDIVVIPIYHPSPISPLSYKGNVPIFSDVICKYIK